MKTHTGKDASWNGVRERLNQIEAGLAESFAPDQRVIDEIYRRRARELAGRHAVGSRTSSLGVLVFSLGTERYAIELSELAEVFPYTGCTAVPGAAAALLGVLNVRGDIRPVADLRRILGLAGDSDPGGYVLMLRHQERAIGFKVDTLDDVRQIDAAQLISAADGGAPLPGSRCVKALTADTLILLDTSAALSHLGFALT